MSAFDPVELVPAAAPGAGEAVPGLLLICDHARNAVPAEVGELGLPPHDMARHIAWDVGARGVTLGLAQRLGLPAVLSTFSRLVIDPNRGEDDPTLVMRLSDGSIIPGNRHIGTDEIERRKSVYYRPYHAAIREQIDRIEAAGHEPVLVSMHSFTPSFQGRPQREWHVGLLWDKDDRLLRPMLELLRAQPDLRVGDNEPYTGQLYGDCMWTHGTSRGVPHILIEIRNDLIAEAPDQARWADRLAPVIRESVARMRAEAPAEVPVATPAAAPGTAA